jgi:Zn finger protein HypA/HybF involved in hydrogenase expression
MDVADPRAIRGGLIALMHESGLATAVAGALRAQALDGARVRLYVTGGHAEPDDFDVSFRFHLAAAAPDLDHVAVEIVHLPGDRGCIGCGRTFAATSGDEPCPTCGGAGLPMQAAERIEIALVRPGDDDA